MIPTYLTPVLVTGTVTTIPSGTQDVNIVSPDPLPIINASVAISTITRVNSAVTSHLLVAANLSRKGLLLYNDGTAQQFVKFGTISSGVDFTVRLTSQGYFEMPYPIYTGQIDVISSSVNGAIQVTELT